MLGAIGIIVSLILLMYLAYRGVSVILLTPILALLAALMGGNFGLLPLYTETYMANLANYVKLYFPIFLLGAIFGKVMDVTGAAKSIAITVAEKLGKDKAILAVVLSCGILTYGGVSLFVVAFAVYPIAVSLFRAADIPKRLIPGSIALGSFTFTMTALPGTPQIQNAIPMPFFKTDTWAAPIMGVVGALILFGLGTAWLMYRAKSANAKGEGYGDFKDAVVEDKDEKLPNFFLSLLPILLVLVLNFVLSKYVFVEGASDWKWLESYKITIGKVGGSWALIVALLIAIVLALVTLSKGIKIVPIINDGAAGSLPAILNTAAAVGYGNVISSLAAFTVIKNGLLGISSNPLVAEGISVSVLAGITGSASGGMSIALGALGDTLLKLATAQGINPEALHRVATLACGGLDTLPHNGAVITLLMVCGMTHKESYWDIAMVSVFIPTVALIAAIIMGTIGIV
ncbi:H+/gluconate symporter [Clostridium amylolyticum]|uniref:H+/gluconate symporter n=1 Tax=Clostridium amylolyticum TaxID=1121298 RepID=A0A1M6NE22_9CLOT|nr:GntP family permease [Clostridium amylolyticum]SHJ93967.1 H+/gluconate symporter [Clostridium amylolyticum]